MRRSILLAWLPRIAGLLLVASGPVVQAAQFARPDGTIVPGDWTAVGAATLHEAIDEVTSNGSTDYVLAADPTPNTTAELSLGDVADPQSGSGHVLRISFTTTGAGAKESCELALYQGAALIASTGSMLATTRGTYSTETYNLTALEADAITDYSDLRLRISSSSLAGGETVEVSWAELEVPDAAGGATLPAVSSPTVSAADTTSAILGATVDTDGGDPGGITERGTAWNTTGGSPITENAVAEGGTALGAFTHVRDTPTMPSGALIYFNGYAVNSAGTGYSSVSTFYTEPTQASGVAFTSVRSTSMTINWSAGGGEGSIVIVKEGAAVPATSLPVDGTEHGWSSAFGSGDDLGSQSYVVYRGPATSADVTGLAVDTTYYVAIHEYAGSGAGVINYQQDLPATSSRSTTSTPSGHNAVHGITNCDQCHAMHGSSTVPHDAEQEAVCTFCHSESGSAAAKSDVGLHVVNGGTTIVDCGACHEVHDFYDFNTDNSAHGGGIAENISRIRWDVAKYRPDALEPAIFQQRPQHFAFGAASPPYNGICQTCHHNTKNHTNDGFDDDDGVAANNNHEIGGNCTTCHGHTGGFAASGCTGCHNAIADGGNGAPTRRAVVGEFSLASHHVVGGAVTDDDCAVCHYEAIDSANYHQNNVVDLRDPDTGNPITAFTKFTRDRSTDSIESWVANVQDNFCMKCHDNDGALVTFVAGGSALRPFSSNSRDVPPVFERFDPANAFHHAVRAPAANAHCIPSASNGGQVTMVAPWNQDATHDQITCFDCHGQVVTDPDGTGNVVSVHGSANQRMVRAAVDFDAMEAAGAAQDPGLLPSGLGGQVEGFCTLCHSAGVYVNAADSEAAGSVYEYHGQSQQQHSAAGGNELGCMGCHGGIADFGPPAPDNGALRGNLHGDTFVWPSGSFAAGNTSEVFMLGGWLGGWDTGTDRQGNPEGYCSGGDCNHTGTSSKNGQSYTR